MFERGLCPRNPGGGFGGGRRGPRQQNPGGGFGGGRRGPRQQNPGGKDSEGGRSPPPRAMTQRRVRAIYMRGGTSRCLVFHEDDLPHPGPARDRILLSALGSPDPY